MTAFVFIGYAGKVLGSSFNISNLPNDWVTITIEPDGTGGDVLLTAADTNTLITVTDSNGVVIVEPTNLSLVQFGVTGAMGDTLIYDYTIITVGGDEYMFLDDQPDPFGQLVNPFTGGNTNPLDSATTTGPHSICFTLGTLIDVEGGRCR